VFLAERPTPTTRQVSGGGPPPHFNKTGDNLLEGCDWQEFGHGAKRLMDRFESRVVGRDSANRVHESVAGSNSPDDVRCVLAAVTAYVGTRSPDTPDFTANAAPWVLGIAAVLATWKLYTEFKV
jgi:hypothetical protein